MFLSKWGSALAIASSPVNATTPPHPTALGLVYGTGSSNGYANVSVNGVLITTLNMFTRQSNYTNEFKVELKRPLPNLPLWVIAVEATGTWQSGSMDSFIEVIGLNVYY